MTRLVSWFFGRLPRWLADRFVWRRHEKQIQTRNADFLAEQKERRP